MTGSSSSTAYELQPIAQKMTRISIPGLLKRSSSSPECRSELLPKLVRAPRLASNFHPHNEATECKFACFGQKVTLCNF